VQKTFLIVLILTSFIGCNNNQKKSIDADKSHLDSTNINNQKLVEKIFYNVPAPLEMAKLAKDAGMVFNPELTNPIENKEYYIDQTSQALNLGVYGADLSYARIFDQIQESVNFLSVIRELTDKLQIPQDEKTMNLDKMEKFIDNRDSLLHVITKMYGEVDIYLKENNRSLVAVMIISGGWIEGNYLALSTMDKNNPNKKVLQRIGEQKYSLESLIKLIEPHVKKDHKSSEILNDFKELSKLYEGVTITTTNQGVETDSANGKTTLTGNTTVEIDTETLMNISEFMNGLRNKITKP
jgi:hypothetical protein